MGEKGSKFKLSFKILLIMGKDKIELINTDITKKVLDFSKNFVIKFKRFN